MATRPYRITDVTVIDTRDGSRMPHRDLHIANGRIAAIDNAAKTAADEAVVEGAGAFVVPGFVDMHSHALGYEEPEDALALMLAFGITGYRQMAGSHALLARRRAGTLTSSRRSPQLLALPGDILTPLNASTSKAAMAEVTRQSHDGADFVKVVFISAEVYFAAQVEATRLGIPMLGHLPTGIEVRAASRAGFHSIEHVGPGIEVIAACSNDEAGVRAAVAPGAKLKLPPFKLPFMDKILARVMAKLVLNPSQPTRPADLVNMQRALDSFDEQKARELARLFVKSGTWHCPTLIRLKTTELCHHDEFRHDPDLRYIAPKVRETWNGAGDAFTAKFSAPQLATFAAQFAMQKKLVGLFDQEGVDLLTGTDAGGGVWVVPGASLHHEFDLFTESGLSPLRVLQAATLNAARFLGREAVAGTVEVGKEADLVLLAADPILDARGLHDVAGVVRDGDFYARVELEAMKADVARRGVGRARSHFRCCAHHA